MIEEELEDRMDQVAPKDAYPETWDFSGLGVYLERVFGLEWHPAPDEVSSLNRDLLRGTLLSLVKEHYQKHCQEFEGFDFREIEKMVLLQMIDRAWKNHLYDLDHLKKSIGLRAYGQKDPKVEYQKESFILFEAMLGRIREQSVEYIFKVQAPHQPPPVALGGAVVSEQAGSAKSGPESKSSLLKMSPRVPSNIQKIGRNDPCYCGSGKKYKKCHG
jgi:preprotein translocase subunit SecA